MSEYLKVRADEYNQLNAAMNDLMLEMGSLKQRCEDSAAEKEALRAALTEAQRALAERTQELAKLRETFAVSSTDREKELEAALVTMTADRDNWKFYFNQMADSRASVLPALNAAEAALDERDDAIVRLEQKVLEQAELPARLNEYDKAEWRDVYFAMKPDATEAEFEDAWTRFQQEKARRHAN